MGDYLRVALEPVNSYGRIKEYVESYRDDSTSTLVQGLSAADEIIKLKALMDQGVITAEEFEAKKRQLLDI